MTQVIFSSTIKKSKSKEDYFNMYSNGLKQISSEKFLNNDFYLFEKNQFIVLLFFKHKGRKPSLFRTYSTLDIAENVILKLKSIIQFNHDFEKITNENNSIKVKSIVEGSIFYTSWGNKTTDICFYQVLFRKGTIVVIQEIAKSKIHDADGFEYCIPVRNSFIGEMIQKRILKDASIKLSFNEYAYLDKERL